MKLWEYSGKRIRLTDVDGGVHIGLVDRYESALDNPDGVACISIGNIEFEEPEIASIEVAEA